MKKLIALILTALMLASVSSTLAIDYTLSPGLVIIKKNTDLKKCGIINRDITFTSKEFRELTEGETELEYITFTSLPAPEHGILKLSGRDIVKGQTVSAKNLDLLRFVPAVSTASTSEFTFTVNGESASFASTCVMNVLESVNLSPETEPSFLSTFEGIDLVKHLNAYDPDGDEMLFEITARPKNGSITVDKTSGRFVYTPDDGYTGKDSFTYTSCDIYGNASSSEKVSITVEKRPSDTTFSDMKGHWAHNSALKMSSLGLMSGKSTGFISTFSPETEISRGDFLALAMIMTGNESNVDSGAVSTFADDSGIPANIRCYAAAAHSMGVVSGYVENGKRYFNWESGITRAEASVILSRLIDAPEPAIVPTFADSDSIPLWADEAIAELVSCGIMNGAGDGNLFPDKALTRAEAAEILCNVSEYLEEREEEQKKEEKKGWLSKLPFFNK